jgi:hypothetical protein
MGKSELVCRDWKIPLLDNGGLHIHRNENGFLHDASPVRHPDGSTVDC